MLDCFNKKLCDYSECDLLTLNTLITKEITCRVKDADTLNMLSNLLASIAANLQMTANQRSLCQKDKN